MINLDTNYSSLYEISNERGQIDTKPDKLSPYITTDGLQCVLIGETDEDKDTMIIKAAVSKDGSVIHGDWMELIGDNTVEPNFDNNDNDPGYGQLRYGGKIHLEQVQSGDYIGMWTMEDGSDGLWTIGAISKSTS